MPKLIKYAFVSNENSYLIKVMCEFCGKIFNDIEKAKKCEINHINEKLKEIFGGNIY